MTHYIEAGSDVFGFACDPGKFPVRQCKLDPSFETALLSKFET